MTGIDFNVKQCNLFISYQIQIQADGNSTWMLLQQFTGAISSFVTAYFQSVWFKLLATAGQISVIFVQHSQWSHLLFSLVDLSANTKSNRTKSSLEKGCLFLSVTFLLQHTRYILRWKIYQKMIVSFLIQNKSIWFQIRIMIHRSKNTFEKSSQRYFYVIICGFVYQRYGHWRVWRCANVCWVAFWAVLLWWSCTLR